MVEPARGAVTVVRARKEPRQGGFAKLGSTVLVLAFIAWLLSGGNVLVMAGILVAGVLLYPLYRRAERRKAARQPDWIEVRADRISAVWAAGHGSELVRTQGSVLQTRFLGGEPRLYLVGPAGDDGSLGLGAFDVEAVGAAAIAHGWQWTPPDSVMALSSGTAAMGPAVEARPGEQLIQLRDGARPRMPGATASMAITVPFAIVVVALAISGLLSSAAVVGIVVGFGVLLGLGMAGWAMLSMRRGSVAVIVGVERLAVKYGSLSAQVVQRPAVGSATVGSRWARMRSPQGRQLMWVPLKPQRDEVLAALQRYGWPVSEAPAGFRRH